MNNRALHTSQLSNAPERRVYTVLRRDQASVTSFSTKQEHQLHQC